MFFQTSLGIQLEKSAATFALVRSSVRGTRVTASEVVTIDPDAAIKERAENLGALIINFLRRYRISPASISLGLPREAVILRTVTLPLAVKENLRGTLSYEMEKYSPFKADDIYYDFQILDENRRQNKLQVLLCIARRDDVNAYLRLKDLIGTGFSEVAVSSTAIVNGLVDSLPGLRKQSFSMIYLTKGYVEIGRVKEGRLEYSRVFEDQLNSQNRAETLIKRFAQVQSTFDQDGGSADVILCGPGADERLETHLREEGLKVLSLESSNGNIMRGEVLPAFGLALAGLKPVANSTNLLPIELQKRPSKAPYYLMFFLLITALLTGSAWWGSGIVQRRLAYERLSSEVDRLRAEATKSKEIEKKCDAVQKAIDDLASHISMKTPVVGLLKDLTERIPTDAWLTQFTFSNGKFTIGGYADTASELITLLEGSPAFRDVVFLSTIRKTREGKEQFRIGFAAE